MKEHFENIDFFFFIVVEMSLLWTRRNHCNLDFGHSEVKISEINLLEKNMIPRTSRLLAKCSDQ